MVRIRGRNARASIAVAATIAVVASGAAATNQASGAATKSKLAPGVSAAKHSLKGAIGKKASATPRYLANKKLPDGVPNKGSYAFLLKLSTASTATAYNGARAKGTSAAKSAARSQLRNVTAAQNRVIAELPGETNVIYRTHAALSAVAVTTDVHNYGKLVGLRGVTAVYPIAPKSLSNAYAVPLQGAPEAWEAYGDLGQNATVGIIDTGIDYTHADFGGPGTVDAYNTAHAAEASDPDPDLFPNAKVVGGYDLAGDSYNADPNSPDYQPVPHPDNNPLDCNSHGTHVAGTVAGYGENADGSTYTGAYDTNTPFDSMKIGPGMAPKAKLYAFRVFGCDGSTNLVGAAIDRALDPNGDGDMSDHVDVINMSLGSDFGSPQDGDSVASDAASAQGVNVVVASGNAGDVYDIGGSPGDAPRTIAVAASADASSVVDSLNVTAPSAASYPAERSIAYDYDSKPDLSGDVAQVTDPTNLDGCAPLNSTDASAVDGKIAFVEWTDNDTSRRCGSVARSANLKAAGAIGFIFADDEENFAAGITGDADIPGVLVAKSGGDAIRSELAAGTTVTIGSTTKNGATQIDESQNDTLAGFSSRGIRGAGDTKPDVTAVGVSVFSAGNGTGNDGLNDSGTSMATPMVAGTAALVSSQHRDWNPEQVKADIMNTAGQPLYTDVNHTGDEYAPNRVGAGRIDVKDALDNQVVAYVTDDPGAVTASFGALAVTEPETLTKTIKVQNLSNDAHTYDVAYQASTSVPGAVYTVSPESVSLDPRSSKTVTLTLTLDPSKLTKTMDPTVDATQAGLPREFVADASGLVMLTSPDSSTPDLRVPVYSAPRPASIMTQPSTVQMPGGSTQTAFLPLSGQRVNQGQGSTTVQSTVAGFELAATSGPAPTCSDTVTSGCVNFPDERSADLKYVGVTSDAQQVSSIGDDPKSDGLAYFSVTTQGPWRTAASEQEFDILIDTDGDGTPDLATFNTRYPPGASSLTDVIVAETIDLNTGHIVDLEPIDDRFGDTDIALFDSDTLVMPVAISSLDLGDSSRIKYGVASFSPYQSAPVDTAGLTDEGVPTLSTDPLHPGVAVYGSYDGDSSALLYRDSPGSVLAVRRNTAAYGADHGMGALIVHFHNLVGNKAQRVALKTSPAVTFTMTPNPVKKKHATIASVTVTNTSGVPATGTVHLERLATVGKTTTRVYVGSGTVTDGKATVSYTPTSAGTFRYEVLYYGDSNYYGHRSSAVTLKVTP